MKDMDPLLIKLLTNVLKLSKLGLSVRHVLILTNHMIQWMKICVYGY